VPSSKSFDDPDPDPDPDLSRDPGTSLYSASTPCVDGEGDNCTAVDAGVANWSDVIDNSSNSAPSAGLAHCESGELFEEDDGLARLAVGMGGWG
jgi:hypothetical protein